jgi:hypothetical protein
MSRIKTTGLIFLIFLSAAPAAASQNLFRDFAICAGRYSAALSHAWLMNSDAAEDYEHNRAVFASLVEASVPAGEERHALALRIDARMAFASLLTQADFSFDKERADHARHLAHDQIRVCRLLTLDS